MNDSANDKTPAGPWPRRLVRILRPVRWAAYVALAGAAALVFTPAGNWLGDRLIRIDPVEQADYIVVLGGDVERSVEAARLYREGWASKVIVSSLGQAVEHYGRVLAIFGVPESAILRDRQSDRTAAHPASIAGLAGIDREKTRLIVVTSLYHTSRARACFVQAGYRHIVMRAPAWRITSSPPCCNALSVRPRSSTPAIRTSPITSDSPSPPAAWAIPPLIDHDGLSVMGRKPPKFEKNGGGERCQKQEDGGPRKGTGELGPGYSTGGGGRVEDGKRLDGRGSYC